MSNLGKHWLCFMNKTQDKFKFYHNFYSYRLLFGCILEKEETREFSQPLKTLPTLPEDSCPVANTHTEQLTATVTPIPGH